MEEVSFDDRRVPKAEIDWERSCWWWYPLTRAIHPAIRSSSLLFSLLGILVAGAGWRLGKWLFDPALTDVASPLNHPLGLFSSQLFVWITWLGETLVSVQSLGLREIAFLTFEFVWLTVTLAMFGGLIARRSIVELGQRTVAPWGESLKLVLGRWQSFLWAAMMHLVGIVLLLLPPLFLGLISRLGSAGAIVAGILLILSFPLVFGVGRFVLSLTLCYPLSVCAIATEKKADAFEGFSRSNAYFFQRPVVAVLCSSLLLATGYVGEQLVYWTLSAGWGLVRLSYLWSGGATEPAAGPFVAAGNWLTQSLIAAFWFSYLWSASGALYLILRRCVDHTELDAIDFVESTIEQNLPEIPAAPVVATPAPQAE